jgi:hypothetical protein
VACLSPWQVDSAERFCRHRQQNITAEQLCRLESFLHVYCLFDRIFIPAKYRASAFIAALDPKHDVFCVDPEIADPFSKVTANGVVIEINPALLFKNEAHLRSKSAGWLQQHLALDIPRRARKAMVEEIDRRAKLASIFYKIILAEYDTQWSLAIHNDAFSTLFASVFQISLPTLGEIPTFLAYLGRLAQTGRAVAQPSGPAGTYNFELPTGAVRAQIAMPVFLKNFLRLTRGEDPIAALRSLRHSYESCREAYRPAVDEFIQWRGESLVVSSNTGPRITQWNDHVRGLSDVSGDALLIRSDVAAVQLEYGPLGMDFYREVLNRTQAVATFFRLAPHQSFAPGTRPALDVSALSIKDVLPFRRSLFRMGRSYRNARSIAHKGLGAIVSFPLHIDSQVPRSALNDSAVRERPAHLYLVCTRPRITINPDIRVHSDCIEMELWFQQETGAESERIAFPHSGVHTAIADPQKGSHVVFYGRDDDLQSWSVSLLYQRFVQSTLPQRGPLSLAIDGSENFPADIARRLTRTDLHVLYIGQSQGREIERTAVNRLGRHEKWDVFERYLATDGAHEELWILLLGQHRAQHLNMTIPSVRGNEHDVAELLQRNSVPPDFQEADCINFIEAGLINYFRPRFNTTFTKGAFPTRRHASYEKFFAEPVDLAAIELTTWESIGCRLYSNRAAARFLHVKPYQLNPEFNLFTPFAHLRRL